MSALTIDYARLADVVREEIARKGYIPNSCILAARLTTHALRLVGVRDVEAMACELDAFSPAYVQMRKTAFAEGREVDQALVDEWIMRGAWHVRASFEKVQPGFVDNRGHGYNGHVVTLVERYWMIDPTLPAVNRPEKDLFVSAPFAWEIDYAEARGRGHVSEAPNGTVAVHRLIPGRKDFAKAGDWWRPRPDDDSVQRILARLLDGDADE